MGTDEMRIWVENLDQRIFLRPSTDAEWIELPLARLVTNSLETPEVALLCFAARGSYDQPIVAARRYDGRLLWEVSAEEVPIEVPPSRSAYWSRREGVARLNCGNAFCILLDPTVPDFGPAEEHGTSRSSR